MAAGDSSMAAGANFRNKPELAIDMIGILLF
jgi:hypothetical protein